uniref:Glutaredoxin n=1 Tax=Leptobrachium leishanense TaxID=445787 RepID=A0A8C5LYS4_9ANUR
MAERVVDGKIKLGKVSVFIKKGCPYCSRSMEIFQKFSFKPGQLEVIDISDLKDMDKIQDYLLEKTGQRTVPRIFFGKESIGGCSELLSLESSGKLEEKLKASGAIQ